MGSFYPAQTGGPDNTVYWITKALTRLGHRPIISSTDRGQPHKTPRGKWLNTEYGEAIYTRNLVHYFPHQVILKALSRIKESDVLHLTMISYPAAFLMAILNSWFYGKPMVWSSRGDLDPPMLARSRRKKSFVLWLVNTFVSKNKVLFHSTCDAETEYIRANFGQRSRVVQIPNYMELPKALHLKKKNYLLFVGRIDPKKGIENLFEALARSREFSTSSTTLKVAGDHQNTYGSELVALTKKLGLENQVEFLGHQSGSDKEILLAEAKVLIMPSHTENFGIVALEALAQGTPAIASTGTPWASLVKYNAGYWVDNDVASLTNSIDKFLKIPPVELEEMGKNALTLATEGFDIHEKAKEWEAAYLTALNKS